MANWTTEINIPAQHGQANTAYLEFEAEHLDAHKTNCETCGTSIRGYHATVITHCLDGYATEQTTQHHLMCFAKLHSGVS